MAADQVSGAKRRKVAALSDVVLTGLHVPNDMTAFNEGLCWSKDAAVRDWVTSAVTRARATGWPAIFWLDINCAHDRELIGKVATCISEHDIVGLDFQILKPVDACHKSLERAKKGLYTICASANLLRDYS